MSERSRKELLLALRPEYLEAGLHDKKRLLDGFVAATGYNRKHAISLLSKGIKEKTQERTRNEKYDLAVQAALIDVWKAANKICSKRLIPFLPVFVAQLEKFDHFRLPDEVKEKLLSLSPATADRLLKQERHKAGRGRGTTKPGHLLKKQIPVRTFAEWDDVIPGFLEADLVAHCGETAKGKFMHTLTMTDISTGWTELVPLIARNGAEVVAALSETKDLLPFSLLGFDSDNGAEFINEEVFDWCEKNQVTFTRSREYRKNDQAHVEEKNGSIVRRYVGYDRYEGVESWQFLSTLYRISRLFINFFQPCLKLQCKVRDGARVRKTYEKAQTPFQRVVNSNLVAEKVKHQLQDLYENLDPVLLLEEIERTQNELWQTAVKANTTQLRMLAANYSESQILNEQVNESISQSPRMKRKDKKVNRKVVETANLASKESRTDLSHVWDFVAKELTEVPGMTGKQILALLMKRYPGQFGAKDLNAIGTRLSRWRKANGITLKSLSLSSWRRSTVNAFWPEVILELEKNPHLTAGEILSWLSERYPGQFRPTHKSSITDKLKKWRIERVKKQIPKTNNRKLAPDWTPERITHWAKEIGPATTHLSTVILERSNYSYPGVRSCLGLLSLQQQYGKERLESACKRASTIKTWTVTNIRSMLKAGEDQSNQQLSIIP